MTAIKIITIGAALGYFFVANYCSFKDGLGLESTCHKIQDRVTDVAKSDCPMSLRPKEPVSVSPRLEMRS